jgi:hypothetical protein
MPFKFNPFTINLDYYKNPGSLTETDPLSLHLDQATPQAFSAGTVTGTGILKVTSGTLGLDTSTYLNTVATPSATIGSVTFTGTGLNDMTASVDAATCSVRTRYYKVLVKNTSPNTFRVYTSYNGATYSANVLYAKNLDTNNVEIDKGVFVKWGATTGHTDSDYWIFKVTNASRDITDVNGTTRAKILADGTLIVGSMFIGYNSTCGNIAPISSNTTQLIFQNIYTSEPDDGASYCLLQDTTGVTELNSKAGQRIYMSEGHAPLLLFGGNATYTNITLGLFMNSFTAATRNIEIGGDMNREIVVSRRITSTYEGKNFTLEAGGATAAQSNKNGGTLLLKSGISTGTGTSKIEFYTAPAGSSGSTDNTLTLAATITSAGIIQPAGGYNSVDASAGITATIVTAQLTALGSQGSMTFKNGILTAQTPAT